MSDAPTKIRTLMDNITIDYTGQVPIPFEAVFKILEESGFSKNWFEHEDEIAAIRSAYKRKTRQTHFDFTENFIKTQAEDWVYVLGYLATEKNKLITIK